MQVLKVLVVSKNPCGPNVTPQREPIMPSASLYCASPNVRQWNREYGVSVSVSHVVCVNFIWVGSERKRNFQWNMSLRHRAIREIVDVN